MRNRAALVLSVYLALFLSPLSSAFGGDGQKSAAGATIEGAVVFEGKPQPRQKLMIVKDRDICGRVDHLDQRLIVGESGGVQNAVVSLTAVRGGKPMADLGSEFILDQKNCNYSPRVLLLPVKKDVTILNNDGILHNIHTFSTKNPPLNIAQTKFQKELKMQFASPERIQVKCDVHGWMGAWFVVVNHPYHAVTEGDGRFSLTGIPPGTYTVSCWQELLGEQTRQVTVEKGSVVTLDFRFAEVKEIGKR